MPDFVERRGHPILARTAFLQGLASLAAEESAYRQLVARTPRSGGGPRAEVERRWARIEGLRLMQNRVALTRAILRFNSDLRVPPQGRIQLRPLARLPIV